MQLCNVDGIRFKIKEDTLFCEKPVYVIIELNLEWYKEIFGFGYLESESLSNF